MNVILDIDETLVQFVGKDDWLSIEKKERDKYSVSETSPDCPANNGLFIYRPHLKEFFEFLFSNPNTVKTVNIWTLSDKDYANDLAGLIKKMNPNWKMKNIWVDTDNDAAQEYEEGYAKNLEYLWDEVGVEGFNRVNTVLIDDLEENAHNTGNKLNGIRIKAFNVLGHKLKNNNPEKTKTKIRSGTYTDLSSDDTLLKVIDILKSVNIKQNPEKTDRVFDKITSVNISGGRRKRKTQRKRIGRKITRKY
jgi:hypothetical protein